MKISGRLLARNTLLNFIGQVIPLLVVVVTIPFIVQGLGTERFGLLSLALIVLGHFVVFDLGLSPATTKFVSEALGKGEQEKIPHLIWTAVLTQAIVGIIGGLVLVGITPLLVERILNIPPNLTEEAKTIFYLLAFSIPVVLISGSFRGALMAAQRFDLVNAVIVPATSLTYLLPLIGLVLGFGLVGIVALILLVRLAVLGIFVVLNLRLTPELKRFSASFSIFPQLFSFGGWVTVFSITCPIFTYLERFLIASFLSLEDLTFYEVPFKIVSQVVILPASMTMTLFPAFSYYGSDKTSTIQELFSKPLTFLFFVMVPITVIFVSFSNEILAVWIGEGFA